MSENYLKIDGKKIVLSNETVEEFRKQLKEFNPLQQMEEVLRAHLCAEHNSRTHVGGDGAIHVSVPNCNSEWYWEVVGALKEFCEKYDYCPVGGAYSKAGYLSVKKELPF